MKRTIISIVCLLLAGITAFAQPDITRFDFKEYEVPGTGAKNASGFRTEFLSYGIREVAEKRNPEKNQYYVPLKMEEQNTPDGYPVFVKEADIPYMWLDRDLFIQIAGVPSYYLQVGNTVAGYGEDSRTPMQFNISDYVKDGINKIIIAEVGGSGRELETASGHPAPTPDIFLFSQPKLRIEDYRVTFYPDPTEDHGVLEFHIAVSNSYNSSEEVTVGYDIYSPQGKLQHYDFDNTVLEGKGKDTVRFRQRIYRTNPNFWTPDNPQLYHGMLTIKKDNRILEYIPYKIGFGKTDHKDGLITRNGTPVTIKAVRYNAAGDKKTTSDNISAFKKHGYNTICTDYPQPVWFYDVCDAAGIYVIDQANINFDRKTDDRNMGGTYSNDPEWLGAFITRNEAAYHRIRNRTCVIGWSIGGTVGNGYNMYETYLHMKYIDFRRAVIFNDAQGEWNSDMKPVYADDGAEVLSHPLPAAPKRKR